MLETYRYREKYESEFIISMHLLDTLPLAHIVMAFPTCPCR